MAWRAAYAAVILLVVFAASRAAQAQDARADAEQEARKAMEKYFEAWNTGDNVQVRKTLNFPFATLGRNGSMVIDPTPEKYTTDFERMKSAEGWHHSVLDSLTAQYVTSDRVHFHVVFSRFHPDNTKYMTGNMLYIVTKRDGHWGPQMRASIAPPR